MWRRASLLALASSPAPASSRTMRFGAEEETRNIRHSVPRLAVAARPADRVRPRSLSGVLLTGVRALPRTTSSLCFAVAEGSFCLRLNAAVSLCCFFHFFVFPPAVFVLFVSALPYSLGLTVGNGRVWPRDSPCVGRREQARSIGRKHWSCTESLAMFLAR